MEYSFDVEIATKHGINGATMMRHFCYWITKNISNGKHFHDGRTWTYNSMKALSNIFPFWTVRQIRKILDDLVEHKVIITGNYNQSRYDRTLWYALADESCCQTTQIHLTKKSNLSDKNDQPIPDIITHNNTNTLNQNDLIVSFGDFYNRYPRKVSKPAALKAWLKIRPNPDMVKVILDALDIQIESEQWLKDNGQFIPHPATWLNNHRWEDTV